MKVNENGILLKVKCLILLNIFSVFPTHVGMFPGCSFLRLKTYCLPHACGDVPVHALVKAGVFPTHVGMFPMPIRLSWRLFSVPHARGDVPRMDEPAVIHTNVWMFLFHCSRRSRLRLACLPHACGVFQKSKNFSFLLASRKCLLYKCFQRTETSVFFQIVCVCAVRVPVYWTGYGSCGLLTI